MILAGMIKDFGNIAIVINADSWRGIAVIGGVESLGEGFCGGGFETSRNDGVSIVLSEDGWLVILWGERGVVHDGGVAHRCSREANDDGSDKNKNRGDENDDFANA